MVVLGGEGDGGKRAIVRAHGKEALFRTSLGLHDD
jgi:hypothetical protein